MVPNSTNLLSNIYLGQPIVKTHDGSGISQIIDELTKWGISSSQIEGYSYWAENSENGKWHFIRESDKIKTYFGGSSTVIGRMLSEPSKLPFVV